LITADDIELQTSSFVSAGSAVIIITTETPRTVGVGVTTEQMDIELGEIQTMFASGLTIGKIGSNTQSIRVEGITEAASSGITDFVSFVAAVDDSRITFAGAASTFAAVAAQADNGISVDTTIIATAGYMHLDGDVDKDNKGDSDNSIAFADTLTVAAKTFLTLEAITGSVLPSGALTLKAGSGIYIYNDITTVAEGRPLVFDADYESAGDGILYFMTSKRLDSNQGTVEVTAADVDFGGLVTSDALTVHTSVLGGTMALGTLDRNLTVSSDDLQSINAQGFVMGNDVNGDVTVSGVPEKSSNNVAGIVSIVALGDDARVLFQGVGSTFNALAVQADNGIDISVDIYTDTGVLSLNGDVDDSMADDPINTISFSNDITLRATGLLNIVGSSSGMFRGGAGTLSLQSQQGIILNADMTSSIEGQKTVINSDDTGGVWSATDISGTGVLTISQSADLNTYNGEMLITASDLDLSGSINVGTSSLLVTVSRSGAPIFLGSSANAGLGFTVSGAELQKITSGGLSLGNSLSSSIEVDGISNADSSAIAGIVSLDATRQNAGISFVSSSSTFSGLAGNADDGIDVEVSMSTTLGSITLNGDNDDSDDGTARDHIAFGTDLSLVSNLDIDLKATTGGIKLAGPVTFVAKRDINIHNKFIGPFGSHAVTVTADSDNDGVGGVSVASAACSIYSSAASCVASRICAWCGSEPKTIGNGLITTSGGAALNVTGLSTSFLSDSAMKVGNLITVGVQSRMVTEIDADMTASIESKFTATPSGAISVYSGALDQVVGSTQTKFDKELKVGYTITVEGMSTVIASVESYKSFTSSIPFSNLKNNVLYTIGNIAGSGTVSTDSGMSVSITGSWPPSATKFLSQVQPGSNITVGTETRVVATVASNQLITVTTPFENSFSRLPYTISNVAGTGSISFDGVSNTVTGSDISPTAFTSELHVGDLVTVSGQTKMVQTIMDDQHFSVSSVFSTPLSNAAYEIGNIHNTPFTLAQKATGSVYTNGLVVNGIGTQFTAAVEVGYTMIVKIGDVYEQRSVGEVNSDTILTLETSFSIDILITSPQVFHYQTCPSQGASLQEGETGTFALHAKSRRPDMCYNTGRCIPQASNTATFERAGQGSIEATTSSSIVSGTGTDFLAQLRNGDSIAVHTSTRIESRKVVTVTSSTIVVVDTPFSFEVSDLPYLIHYLTGTGFVSNDGGANYTVYGTGTDFNRDLAPGYVVAIGNEKRVVTSIINAAEMTISAPFNYLNGGMSSSGFAYDACISGGVATTKQLIVDFATLDPGCCGFKSVGAVSGGNFAYFKVVPPSTNYNLRVVTTSSTPQLEVYMRYTYAPDAINYDFKAVGTSSPWQIELPQNRLKCPTHSASCESLWIGVRGLPGGGKNIDFEVASYLEFNFPNFGCSESSEAALSDKCNALGLKQIGDATFVNDATEPNNPSVMRLTSKEASQTGAVWYNTKVHLENGFETSFKFKMSSECTTTSTTGCGAGDGFAFVIQGSNSSNVIGCGGRSLGFGDSDDEGCHGIEQSFAIEFDTWHNPELRDINVRGAGTVQVNASTVPRYNYVHAAFFSNGKKVNVNSHDMQLAGTPAIPAINNGNWHSGRVVYIPGTSTAAPGRMFLYIDDMQSFVLTAPVRLTKEGACGVSVTDRCVLDSFGNAYLGFTAATSGGLIGQNHDVAKWLFCDEPGCGRE